MAISLRTLRQKRDNFETSRKFMNKNNWIFFLRVFQLNMNHLSLLSTVLATHNHNQSQSQNNFGGGYRSRGRGGHSMFNANCVIVMVVWPFSAIIALILTMVDPLIFSVPCFLGPNHITLPLTPLIHIPPVLLKLIMALHRSHNPKIDMGFAPCDSNSSISYARDCYTPSGACFPFTL
ncbi:hypothetical protein CR513_53562, partial [Mucuna pruriens]